MEWPFYFEWHAQASCDNPLKANAAVMYGALCNVVMPVVYLAPAIFATMLFVLGIVGRSRLSECNELLLVRSNCVRTGNGEYHSQDSDIETALSTANRTGTNGHNVVAFSNMQRDSPHSTTMNSNTTAMQRGQSPTTTFESTTMCWLVYLNYTVFPATLGWRVWNSRWFCLGRKRSVWWRGFLRLCVH